MDVKCTHQDARRDGQRMCADCRNRAWCMSADGLLTDLASDLSNVDWQWLQEMRE